MSSGILWVIAVVEWLAWLFLDLLLSESKVGAGGSLIPTTVDDYGY